MEEKDLEQTAQKIADLGFEVPICFFLEIHKPVSTLIHTASLALEPLASPFLGVQRVKKYQNLLSDRKNIDRLIALIQIKSNGTR